MLLAYLSVGSEAQRVDHASQAFLRLDGDFGWPTVRLAVVGHHSWVEDVHPGVGPIDRGECAEACIGKEFADSGRRRFVGRVGDRAQGEAIRRSAF
ncbi:MAG: hypothetical protein R2709_11965 [Marmoricola sp.]